MLHWKFLGGGLLFVCSVLAVVSLLAVTEATAQGLFGTIQGTVTIRQDDEPLHKARVLLIQLGRTVETADDGTFRFVQVPPGTYDIVVNAPALSAERQTVNVTAGQPVIANFQMDLAPVQERITVTAGGREETSLTSFQSTAVVDSIQLVEDSKASLGEVLEGQPGVAKRSFGPGNSRPVIRGFDGDRVAVLKDGIPTGTLSSQSGDHGETLDTLSLDRVEIVKGPATLLYGANAIGGVVNAITPASEIHDHPHAGVSGSLTGIGGTTNDLGGGSGAIQYGTGNWLLSGDFGGQRTASYHTPVGEVFNSQTRTLNGSGGIGRYTEKSFLGLRLGAESARYGIPAAHGEQAVEGEEHEVVFLPLRRYNGRFTGGLQNLNSFVHGFRAILDYSDYHHEERTEEEIHTTFDNQQFSYRGVFDQRKTSRLGGSFGLSGLHRDYETVGEESITPPVTQNNVALFTLQEVELQRVRLQFGGRLDHTAYSVTDGISALARDRSFTGFSGAAGINVGLWEGGAFVANYTHSYRAPALEELYNHGPHPGNLTFEIGNTELKRERSDGIDLSLKQQSPRIHAEGSFFYYGIRDFVFLAPTGNVEDGLREAEYLQGRSRFLGAEFNFGAGVTDNIWLLGGADVVNADLTSSVTAVTTGMVTPSGTPLPRIPPARGRFGLDLRYRGLSLRPEAVFAKSQDRVFVTETRTAGYTVFNVNASYSIARPHSVQVFSVSAFNLGNRLYQNHLSFIKDIAPEIGRGVRVGYTVRFF